MKRYKYILFGLLLTTALSCGKNNIEKPEEPKNLISEKKMVDILYDMSLVSAAKGVNKKILENKGVHPDKFVFIKHDIDSAQFAESNAYYAFDIRTYQDIYAKVKERLEKDKENFAKIIEQEKKVRDSINKVNKIADSIKKAETKKRDRTNETDSLLGKIANSVKQNQ